MPVTSPARPDDSSASVADKNRRHTPMDAMCQQADIGEMTCVQKEGLPPGGLSEIRWGD
jgi:hypothetical protein